MLIVRRLISHIVVKKTKNKQTHTHHCVCKGLCYAHLTDHISPGRNSGCAQLIREKVTESKAVKKEGRSEKDTNETLSGLI